MNKNWKSYSPKEDSWNKILQKQDFESQLKQNLKKLPEFEPAPFAWGAIEEKLEKKKRAVVWRPFLIAASLTGLFLLAFYLIRQGAVISDEQDMPQEILTEAPVIKLEETNPGSTSEEIIPSKTETQPKPNSKKTPNRQSFEPIKVPNTTLAFSQDLEVNPPDLQPRNPIESIAVAPNESYHRVAISWGLKEKVKLKLGAQSNDWLERSESLRAQEKSKPAKNPLKFIIK